MRAWWRFMWACIPPPASRLRRCRASERLAPQAHLCVYGLYAPMNEALLRGLGVGTMLGGEVGARAVSVCRRLRAMRMRREAELRYPKRSRWSSRQNRLSEVPDRSGLPELSRYAHLVLPEGGRKSRASSRAAAAASTCAAIARWCRCTRASSASSRCGGDGGYRAAGAGGRRAYFLRRPGFFQRPHPRNESGRGHARRIPRADLRRHHQDSAPHRPRRTAACAQGAAGCLFVTVRGGVGGRRRAANTSPRTRLRATSSAPWRCAAKPASPGPDLRAVHPLDHAGGLHRTAAHAAAAAPGGERAADSALHPPAGARRLAPAAAARIQRTAPGVRSEAPGLSVAARRSPRRCLAAGAAGAWRRKASETDWRAARCSPQIWRLAHAGWAAGAAARTSPNFGRAIARLSEPWYCCAEPTEQQLQSF